MGIESGHFLDLRQGQIHPFGKRATMRCREAAETILQNMKIIDQTVGCAICFLQDGLDESQGHRIKRPAARGGARFAAMR